jgi:hypothetical protein
VEIGDPLIRPTGDEVLELAEERKRRSKKMRKLRKLNFKLGEEAYQEEAARNQKQEREINTEWQ